jgi:hypothetical protein
MESGTGVSAGGVSAIGETLAGSGEMFAAATAYTDMPGTSAQGLSETTLLAIRPTIYPAPPGETVTVEDPVSIDVRSAEFRDSQEAIDRLCLAIQQSNQVAREVGDKLVAELRAGLEYVAGPKPSRKVLDLLLVNPLYAAAAIFASTAVVELAKVAIKALFKLISPEVDIDL